MTLGTFWLICSLWVKSQYGLCLFPQRQCVRLKKIKRYKLAIWSRVCGYKHCLCCPYWNEYLFEEDCWSMKGSPGMVKAAVYGVEGNSYCALRPLSFARDSVTQHWVTSTVDHDSKAWPEEDSRNFPLNPFVKLSHIRIFCFSCISNDLFEFLRRSRFRQKQ